MHDYEIESILNGKSEDLLPTLSNPEGRTAVWLRNDPANLATFRRLGYQPINPATSSGDLVAYSVPNQRRDNIDAHFAAAADRYEKEVDAQRADFEPRNPKRIELFPVRKRLAEIEEALEFEFRAELERLERQFTKFMDVIPGQQRSYHEEPIVELEPASIKSDSGLIRTACVAEVGVARYVFEVYGLSFEIDDELLADPQLNKAKRLVRHLVRSIHYTRETVSANVLNRAWDASYTGWDGKPLLSLKHAGSAFEYANTTKNPMQLSVAGLKHVVRKIQTSTDLRGRPIVCNPRTLIISPDQRFVADRALQDENLAKLGIQIAIVHRLVNPYNWFVKTDAADGLQFIERRAIGSEMISDEKTSSIRFKGDTRFAAGWTNPLGCFGAQGF